MVSQYFHITHFIFFYIPGFQSPGEEKKESTHRPALRLASLQKSWQNQGSE